MSVRRYVAVIGPADASPAEAAQAHRVGYLLARSDVIVVNGGLGGVMEAAARGAEEAGGISIGLLPGMERGRGLTDDRPGGPDPRPGGPDGRPHSQPNGPDPGPIRPAGRILLPTGLGELRNGLVVRCADVVIAVGGSWGTLSEIALAIRIGKPLVSVGGWRISDASGNEVIVQRATTAAEAVTHALAILAGISSADARPHAD